ncbi:MAG: ribosome maturation factor RimP [Candidatus Eisenbacteria sp.]|nr:ribosome maturation factor RimP [Candidatus Eisenbacteria bacterium]
MAPSFRERIEEIAETILTGEGYELVETRMNLGGPRPTLTFFISKPGGSISLGDCARASRALEDEFDSVDLVGRRYVLEVSSAGLDRLLRGERDFVRFRGERARVTTRHPIGKQKFFQGILGEVCEEALAVELDSGESVRIPLAEISTARLEVVF